MKRQPDVTLVLPCYNEESVFQDCVHLIIRTLEASPLSFEILFVDDGSTDRTKEMIKSIFSRHPCCRYVFHKTNLGRGAAVSTGIQKARGAIVGYMDIDCEVSPLYIPSLIAIIKGRTADVVVGKRIYRTSLTSIVREALSIGYRMIAGSLLDTGGIDTESGYKFFNKRKFLPVLMSIKSKGWFWDTESIVLSRCAGLEVAEVPVLFSRRFDKQSSVRIIPDTLSYIRNVWELSRRLRKEEKNI